MPWFWQRSASEARAALTQIREHVDELDRKGVNHEQQLESLKRMMQHITTLIETNQASAEHMGRVIAESVTRQAWHWFREGITIFIDGPEDVQASAKKRVYLPIDPRDQLELIFFHPQDPSNRDFHLVIGGDYQQFLPLNSTYGLYIDSRTCPPGLGELLMHLHQECGPVILVQHTPTHPTLDRQQTFKVNYWAFSGAINQPGAPHVPERYRHNWIFYYLKASLLPRKHRDTISAVGETASFDGLLANDEESPMEGDTHPQEGEYSNGLHPPMEGRPDEPAL